MPIYKQTTELTKIADFFTATEHDITEVYFGDQQVFTVWGEYDGTLPTTYRANGSAVSDYRVYGSVGGVGDRTVNHLSVKKLLQYENSKHYRDASGNIVADNNTNFSELLIPVDENTVYTVRGKLTTTKGYVRVYYLREDFTWISRSDILQSPSGQPTPSSRFNFTTPANTKYIQIQYGINTVSTDSKILLIEGSTAPMEYVPYGYAVPMSVSDGTTSTTTPIYIGDTPLGEDEYVSFKEQKVYRRTENLFDGEIGLDNTIIQKIDGTLAENTNYALSRLIPVEPGNNYTFSFDYSGESQERASYPGLFYKQDMSVVQMNYPLLRPVVGKNSVTLTAPSLAKYFRLQWKKPTDSNVMLVEGSTAPAQYIPYLQPTDPPVPLPAFPTVDGTNIVDYAGQSAAVPSRFVAKYRKEDF